ncbi:MAG: hypothetical protein M1445_10075 [Bacteroidetes bacterium]|nr:hypothetical protein [Bacteroidota bacterium]MCL6101230.1 hypothetical protein [Bacteroidota bacterium]
MQLKINIGYDEVYNLVKQLPKSDIKKLTISINRELVDKSKKDKKSQLTDLILNSPMWTDEEMSNYLSVRDYINNSRMS